MNNHGSRMIAFALLVLAGVMMVGFGSITTESELGPLQALGGLVLGIYGLVLLSRENGRDPGNL